tara:strand:- start:702 stop:938 length:237 start_codon:yes stop_codon:yes gene_type:complete
VTEISRTALTSAEAIRIGTRLAEEAGYDRINEAWPRRCSANRLWTVYLRHGPRGQQLAGIAVIRDDSPETATFTTEVM